jgi:hypothetical protein
VVHRCANESEVAVRRSLLFLLLCVACGSSVPATRAELNTQIAPYDFAQKTPEKISELLKSAVDDTEPSANARYVATRARLDWFLSAWINDDTILLDKLGQHLGVVGCSHQEKREQCLKEIPEKILKEFGESSPFLQESVQLKSLLSALQLGPGNAAMALGVHSASKKTGEIGLRAKVAIIATALPVVKSLPSLTRRQALETLAFRAPFLCPDSFMALDPKQGNDIDVAAAYCGFACPTHRNGVLSSEDTIKLLLDKCTIEYYGFASGQAHFVTKRNFVTIRLLQYLSQQMTALSEAKDDPLAPLISPALQSLRPKFEELRFYATIDTESTADGLSFSQQTAQYLIDSTPYLVLRGSQVYVALWPTLRSKAEKIELSEQQYSHPGKLIGSTQDTSSLAKEISDAASFEFSLGPRFSQEELLASAPPLVPAILGAPEGTRPRGKPIFLMSNADATFQEFFTVGRAATEAGYGRVRLLTNLYELRWSSTVSAMELLFANGEDLALLEKSPLGFPGGALIVMYQPGSLRAVLAPGLEKSGIDKKALDGIKLEDKGEFDDDPRAEFFSYFSAKRIIFAVAPGIKMKQVAELLDQMRRSNPAADILLTLAPDTDLPAWVKTLPRTTGAAFEASNNFSAIEVGP